MCAAAAVLQTMAEEESGSFDLIQLSGPLTVEAILKSLQQRFMEGNCYVRSSLHTVASQ